MPNQRQAHSFTHLLWELLVVASQVLLWVQEHCRKSHDACHWQDEARQLELFVLVLQLMMWVAVLLLNWLLGLVRVAAARE